MTRPLQKILECENVDLAMFREIIVPQNKPVVLKGLVANWPAVREGMKSPGALVEYIKRFDQGRLAQILVGDPAINGQFFYTDDNDLLKVNFRRQEDKIGAVMDWLIEHQADERPYAVAVQAVPTPEFLPNFSNENSIGLPPISSVPRIWIGNAVTIATHYDVNYNIACVVTGRRRFTLFPPEQLPNLYIGPLDHTPAGSPASMVNFDEPDLVRYPRFVEALATAQQAELEPGDAIYIPYVWWHHVKSLANFNVLVNYWWNEATSHAGRPFNCLAHAFLGLRELPPDQREVWRMIFDHYVFQTNGDPAAHLGPSYQGIMRAPLSPELAAEMRANLIKSLGG